MGFSWAEFVLDTWARTTVDQGRTRAVCAAEDKRAEKSMDTS